MLRLGFVLTTALAATASAQPTVTFVKSTNASPNPKDPIPYAPSDTPIGSSASSSTSSSATSLPTALQCQSDDTSSIESVQNVIQSSGAIDWLDSMLNSMWQHEKDWVTALWQSSFPKEGIASHDGCGQIDGDCNFSDKCSDYPDHMTYLVFASVAKLHSKINSLHSQLLWTGWLDSLTIDQIAADFSTPNPDSTWPKWVATAFAMAANVGPSTYNPDAGAMWGLASASLNMVAMGASGVDVDKVTVQTALKNIVGKAGDNLESILRNATGYGDASTLPIHTWTTLRYPTARFFNDPSILLDKSKDNATFVGAFETFTKNVEKKLADVALQSAYWILLGREDMSQDTCNEKGLYWLEANPGQYLCFYLSRPASTAGCENLNPTTCNAFKTGYDFTSVGDDVYDKLSQHYGIDVKSYYTSLIDCDLHGNGQVDMSSFIDGQIPRCWYNVYVRKGKAVSYGSGLSIEDI